MDYRANAMEMERSYTIKNTFQLKDRNCRVNKVGRSSPQWKGGPEELPIGSYPTYITFWYLFPPSPSTMCLSDLTISCKSPKKTVSPVNLHSRIVRYHTSLSSVFLYMRMMGGLYKFQRAVHFSFVAFSPRFILTGNFLSSIFLSNLSICPQVFVFRFKSR